MKLRGQHGAAAIAALFWISTAIAQTPPDSSLVKFSVDYEMTCHQTQAARLKALQEPVSELQKMQLEMVDKDVCPCMAMKIAGVTDASLAARILANDKAAQSAFFEPAFQQCSVAVLRKMALPTCRDDIANSTLAHASVEASCRCYSEAVSRLDDATIRDDAVAAYLNYQARSNDQSIAPYVSKLEVLRLDCLHKHSR